MVDWLHEPGLSCEAAGVEDTARGGNDLPTTAVNSVGMECHVIQIEADIAHILVTQDTLVV